MKHSGHQHFRKCLLIDCGYTRTLFNTYISNIKVHLKVHSGVPGPGLCSGQHTVWQRFVVILPYALAI